MHKTLLLLVGMGLSGCAGSPAEMAMSPEKVHAREDQTCRSYGTKPGTQQYTDCRLRLAEMRSREHTAIKAAIAAPSPGIVSCSTFPTGGGMTMTNCF